MFTKTAEFYDAIYSWKNYERESKLLIDLIGRHKRSSGNSLLDVACGTGAHIAHLKGLFAVEGLDLDDQMLAIARAKHPEIRFHRADMIDFDLGREFDVVVCLFSAIGYAKKLPMLDQAVATMAQHVAPGGVLIIEPWLTPEKVEGAPRPPVHSLFVDRPDLKIARLNSTIVRDNMFRTRFHYLIGQNGVIHYRSEFHELGLFTHEQYLSAFSAAGLDPLHDAEGLMGRGLYFAVRG